MEIFFQTPKVMYVAKFRRIFHDPRGLLIVPLQERIKEHKLPKVAKQVQTVTKNVNSTRNYAFTATTVESAHILEIWSVDFVDD